MDEEVAERARDRLKRIVEMKETDFISLILQDAVGERLEHDDQLGELVLLSEQSRRFVDAREEQAGFDDTLRSNVAELGVVLDDQIHRRANEVIANMCASIVRQDEEWIADDPDSVGMTDIHAMEDAIHEASSWLDAHEEVVNRLELTYPDRW